MNKQHIKKNDEELQEYLLFRRRNQRIVSKKGKGTVYNRSSEKSKARKQEDE